MDYCSALKQPATSRRELNCDKSAQDDFTAIRIQRNSIARINVLHVGKLCLHIDPEMHVIH